jgi:hypothetical protein
MAGLELYDISGLGAFGRVDNVELNLLTFCQGLESAVLNVAEMYEHISALFTGNEAETLGVIEPLHGTFFHGELPPSCEIEADGNVQQKTAKAKALCGLPNK